MNLIFSNMSIRIKKLLLSIIFNRLLYFLIESVSNYLRIALCCFCCNKIMYIKHFFTPIFFPKLYVIIIRLNLVTQIYEKKLEYEIQDHNRKINVLCLKSIKIESNIIIGPFYLKKNAITV